MRGDCYRCVYYMSHRCANQWIGDKPCPDGMKFTEYTDSEVKQCILATVEIYQDGYMHCPVLDCYGCEYCYKRMEDDDFEFQRWEDQNYSRFPKWATKPNEGSNTMKKQNARCPLQSECDKSCKFEGKENTCDYYNANTRPGYEIQGLPAPEYIDHPEAATPAKSGNLVYISIDKLFPHPHNPRKDLGDLTELAESIKAQGIIQNLTVVPYEINWAEDGKAHISVQYRVIIGHRRMAAAKLAGLTELPCTITEMDDRTQIGTMLLENIQRADLTVMEQADGFQMMLDLGESVKGISGKTGFSETTVKHRLKLNELDKKKLQEASMRGGRIEDYIALEKIKSQKVRDKLLEDVGTRNFDWNLKCAIKEQETPERKKALVCELNKFAKPIKEKETSGLSYVTSWYNFDGKVEKRADTGTVEYFYTVDNYRATLYRKSEKEAPKEKSAKEKAFGKRESKLKALTKSAYELRSGFVRDFTAVKKYTSEINAFAFRRLLRYGGAELDIVLKLLGIEKPEGQKYDQEAQRVKRGLIFDKYMEQPELVMLNVAYATYEDKPGNGYFYAQSYNGFKIEHKNNSDLDAIYDGLISLGYDISDEEIQLRCGTHELFDKLAPGDVKADADDEEEPENQEEDDAE